MTSNALVYVPGFERGVRPMGCWSMAMTLSSASRPVDRVVRADGLGRCRGARGASAGRRMPLTSELLPAPLTPVTAVKHAEREAARRRSRRLCSRAPLIVEPRARRAPRARAPRCAACPRGTAPVRLVARLELRRAFRSNDDLAAEVPGARAEVDDVVGGADRLLVVLDDEDACCRDRAGAAAWR